MRDCAFSGLCGICAFVNFDRLFKYPILNGAHAGESQAMFKNVIADRPTTVEKRLQFRQILFTIAALIATMPARSQSPSSVDLTRALAPEHPCRSFQQPIQFFSETSLIVLSGAEGYCYSDVSRLKLNLISTDGRILARRNWPSTDSGTVITSGRLVLVTGNGLEVDDQALTPIQVLELPQHRFPPRVLVHKQSMATVLLNEGTFLYGGVPLRLLGPDDISAKIGGWPGFEFDDGQTILKNEESLDLRAKNGNTTKVGSLEWVIPPCKDYVNCQAYDAGTHIEVSSGQKKRVLVISNGSRFPITDAAGLFPYFRLEIFDIDSRRSVYREEHITRTGERYACISSDGDLLATTDGRTVVLRKLP